MTGDSKTTDNQEIVSCLTDYSLTMAEKALERTWDSRQIQHQEAIWRLRK